MSSVIGGTFSHPVFTNEPLLGVCWSSANVARICGIDASVVALFSPETVAGAGTKASLPAGVTACVSGVQALGTFHSLLVTGPP